MLSSATVLHLFLRCRKMKNKGTSTRATLRRASLGFFRGPPQRERPRRARPYGGGCRDPTESSFNPREREKNVTRRALCCAPSPTRRPCFSYSRRTSHGNRSSRHLAERMPRLFSRDATIQCLQLLMEFKGQQFVPCNVYGASPRNQLDSLLLRSFNRKTACSGDNVERESVSSTKHIYLQRSEKTSSLLSAAQCFSRFQKNTLYARAR